MSSIYNNFYYEITYQFGALTQSEIEHNVTQIAIILRSLGWTDNAIAGLVGNIQSEGLFNPGQCENSGQSVPSSTYDPSFPYGLGLCQWTSVPNRLMEYAQSLGGVWYDGEIQCKLADTGAGYFVQTIAGYTWNHSFQEFKTWAGDPGEAAIGWLYNYERPQSIFDGGATAEQARQTRAARARIWYQFITGIPWTGNAQLVAILTATRKKKKGGVKIK